MIRKFLFLLSITIMAIQSTAFVAPRSRTHFERSVDLNMWSDDGEMRGLDRLKSCVPYLLPLLDGDHFGRYIYSRIPPLGALDALLLEPLLGVYRAIPFGGLIFFFALSFGSRNSSFSRSVRFNAQQAILIDIFLIFPELIGGALSGVQIPRSILEPSSNFVFYFYMTAVIYSIVSNLQGKKPDQIPIISQAAEQAMGPF